LDASPPVARTPSRIATGHGNRNRFEATEAEALRRADETFGRTRTIRNQH